MAKGIIYCMTTILSGFIKIGKTSSDQFENRMYNLEHNGYQNITGLKRYYAIEVEDYDEKEKLLHTIFSKSNVPNTELFAVDPEIVRKLLSSFEGKQVYPENQTQEEVFEEATQKEGSSYVPNGKYYLTQKIKIWGNKSVKGVMEVRNGQFIVLAGSIICTEENPLLKKTAKNIHEVRKTANLKEDILLSDVVFDTPSAAAMFVIGAAANGWTSWKTADGKPIDIYRSER